MNFQSRKRSASEAGLAPLHRLDDRPLKMRRLNDGSGVGTSYAPEPITLPYPGGGGFQRASPEVLAQRKIVRARRRIKPIVPTPIKRISNSGNSPFNPQSTPLSNPFSNPFSVSPNSAFSPFKPQSDQQSSSSPKKPDPFDFSSLDIKQSVNEMGLWQMDDDRLDKLTNQRSTYVKGKSITSKDIRITSVQNSDQQWGNSADENVRTQLQRDRRKDMGDDEAEMSFNQRSQQATLLWKTGSSSLTQYGDESDLSEPLSGHTPGIKKLVAPGTTGALTKEHGRRDIRRQSIVETTLNDSQRKPSDVPIMSKLATVQLMQSPEDELMTVKSKVDSSSHPFHSQFEDLDKVSNSSNFDKLAKRVQVVRETDKMHIARNMLISGYDSLVPDTHKQLLSQSKGSVSGAMKLLHQQSTSDKPTISFNTATQSQTTRLDLSSLRQMSTDKTTQHRPLSPVRKVSAPSFSFGGGDK